MTPEQTTTMFKYFAEAWPAAQVGDHTPAVWVDALADVKPELGRVAAKALVAKCKWFPSIAEFMEEVGAAKRAAETPRNSLDSGGVCDAETNRRWLAACREVVDARKGAWAALEERGRAS